MTAFSRGPGIARNAALWALFISLETTAQITLKLAAADPNTLFAMPYHLPAFLGSAWFLMSIACDAANLLIWLTILARLDLSVAVPLSSGTYLAVVVAAWAYLNEPVSSNELLGIALICGGILLIGASEKDTTGTRG